MDLTDEQWARLDPLIPELSRPFPSARAYHPTPPRCSFPRGEAASPHRFLDICNYSSHTQCIRGKENDIRNRARHDLRPEDDRGRGNHVPSRRRTMTAREGRGWCRAMIIRRWIGAARSAPHPGGAGARTGTRDANRYDGGSNE